MMPAGGGTGAAGAGVTAYIAAWQPSSANAAAASFARAVVERAGPHGRQRAKNLLWAAGKLAGYGIGLGLEPVPEVLLHPSVIERFTAHAPGLSGPARRTLRTNLRFLARAAVPALCPADASLPRERAKAPYSPAQIDGYLALAGARPTAARRMRPAGLVCPGGGTGLPRLDASRLRATWLADCADLLGLATFLHAAGITCSQRLGDIIATLDPGDEAAAVQLLGASAW